MHDLPKSKGNRTDWDNSILVGIAGEFNSNRSSTCALTVRNAILNRNIHKGEPMVHGDLQNSSGGGRGESQADSPPAARPAPLDPQEFRGDFPILSAVLHQDKPLVYLDNAASSQRPRQVIDRIVQVYEKDYANVHRGVHWLSDRSTDLYEESRESVRKFINAAQRHEVIFTSGTTASVNIVARSWGDCRVGAGDEILLTEMEHNSNIVPWQQLAQRTGCLVRFAPVRDDGFLDLDAFSRMLNSKTRLVAFTSMSNVLGTMNPMETMIQRSHDAGALVFVDAAQSAPHLGIDVQTWNADFVAFSGHKMLGPSGVGILYGRERILDSMPPFLGGGSMIRRVTLDGFEAADLPAKFEAGTPPIVPAIALGSAIDYLEKIGLQRIHAHEVHLSKLAHEALEQLGGIKILGPPPQFKGGIVSFVVEGVHAHDVAQILDAHGVAIRAGHHCAMPLHKRLKLVASNRASFYLYNTSEEVELLARAVAACQRVFRRRK